MVADVIFHQFGHEGVDGAASGGEALEDVGAVLFVIEAAQDTFELADDFLGAVDEVEFFSGSVGHSSLTTLEGYGIKHKLAQQEPLGIRR